MSNAVRRTVTLILSPVLLHAIGVTAAEVDADTELEAVEVWGTKIRSNQMQLEGTDIEFRQADHISDLLRQLPGVDVGGAHSLNQRITIRSLGDRNLRITIDGANQNNYMYHHMGNLQIHADILQSVDVEVGRNSVVNAGLGGAVRFETRQARDLLRGDQRFGGRAQIAYADNASQSQSLSLYGLLSDDLDALAYYNRVQRDNYDVGGGRIRAYDGSTVPGTDGTVRGLEGTVQDMLLRLGWNLSDSQRLKFGYERYADKGDYSYRPDMGLATGLAIANSLRIPLLWPTEFTRDTFTLNHEWNLGEGNRIRTTLYHNNSDFWRDERGMAAWLPPFATINQGGARNSGGNLIGTTRLAAGWGHDLTWGIGHVRHDTAYIIDAVKLAGERADTTSLFVQDAIALGEHFTLTPGLRYDTSRVDGAVVDDRFDDMTAALSLELRPMDGLTLRLSGTQLFKAPELSEVFIGAGLYDAANPDLRAEGGRNVEFGVSVAVPVAGDDRFNVGVTLFHTRIDNYVYDYAETDTFYGRDNVGDMRIKGVEAEVGYDFGALRAAVNYSRSRSDLVAFAEYASLDGARIDREQGDTIAFGLDYMISPADLTLRYEVLLVDDKAAGLDLDGATADNAKDGFGVHNISAQWLPSAWQGLAVTLGVDNLFDEFYASQSSRTGLSRHPRFGQLYLQDYEPGRNIKATVSYRF
jgi:hemoglobin/transferrin/lactoferrin receptor protein